MSDEELEALCDKALKRIMEDNRYLIHLLIKAMEIRVERMLLER